MRITMAVCVSCGDNFDVGPNTKKGQYIDCPTCDAMLEVVSISPLILDWVDDESDNKIPDGEYIDDDWAVFDHFGEEDEL